MIRQRLRLTAASLLVVWLLALASSVAQACVTRMDSVPMTSGAHEHCALPASDMAQDDAATGDASTVRKAACAKFCADTPVPQPAAKLVLDDATAGFVLALPPAPLLLLAGTHQPVEARAPPAPSPSPGSRIPIAFLRLTL